MLSRLPVIALVGCVGVLVGCGIASRAAPHFVDLTYPFDEQTVYWPNNEPFVWRKTAWGPGKDGRWYASAAFSTAEHGGTHIDAPIHFAEGRATVDEIPPERLTGPAAVIDVVARCTDNREYEVQVSDLVEWERRHGRIPEHAIVLIRTGWGRYWPDRVRYLGTPTPDDAQTLHFPGLSAQAAEFLATRRIIAGVGIDTASIDPGRSPDFPVHRILNGANRYILENVAGLDRLPEHGAVLYAWPMKIKGGTGGPVRIIAQLP